MASFSPPTVSDLPSINRSSDPYGRDDDTSVALFKFFGTRGPRGRTVVKIAGVYSTVDYPPSDLLASCDQVIWPSGEKRPEYYLGGHVYIVTDAQAASLVAAGFSVDVAGGYEQGYEGGY